MGKWDILEQPLLLLRQATWGFPIYKEIKARKYNKSSGVYLYTYLFSFLLHCLKEKLSKNQTQTSCFSQTSLRAGPAHPISVFFLTYRIMKIFIDMFILTPPLG